ncbi:hypothetical protein BRADI_5g06621v3 [Brachypodium distachyon]|uniref:Uncharacterized protein n=1 Tax=Brachypodium distachyon TaxID=15368 RepID=A0A2K2CFN6_BRADI|nr:hypothetical protein BRADI_5g06621v3 [Brachypodium distachyon]
MVVWRKLASQFAIPSFDPSSWDDRGSTPEWCRSLSSSTSCSSWAKCARSLATLACWEIWKERNRRTFDDARMTLDGLLVRIGDEALHWKLAGGLIPFDPG